MLLVDWQIRNLCVWGSRGKEWPSTDPPPEWRPMISPFSEATSGDRIISYGLTHAGLDLRLGREVYVFKNSYGEHVDPKMFSAPGYLERMCDRIVLTERKTFILPVHGTILATSLEYVVMPRDLKGRCVGKSTWARCAVGCNTTPLEPGWEGNLTVELSNFGPSPVVLHVGEGICQLEFEQLAAAPETDYAAKGGKYQHQKGATPPRVL